MKNFLLKQNEANLVKSVHPAKDLSETYVFQMHQVLNFQKKPVKGIILTSLICSTDFV